MKAVVPNNESRSIDQLRSHYLIERELADRLRQTTKEQRCHLYTALYDELYRRVPSHPQLTRKADAEAQARAVKGRIKMLSPFLRPDSTYLEIGPGDCALALEVAKSVKWVYAVDVSEEIGKGLELPGNFQRIISDGCSVPVDKVDIAFSDQLMEHLHPDDALEQLRNINSCLKPGGMYLCVTPNRLSGPHDVSRYFDDLATGFHLKEYTVTELVAIFKQSGFKRVRSLVGFRGFYRSMPTALITALEKVLEKLPTHRAKKLARTIALRPFLGITLVGFK
jgi:SAM-dependent methyltransferase